MVVTVHSLIAKRRIIRNISSKTNPRTKEGSRRDSSEERGPQGNRTSVSYAKGQDIVYNRLFSFLDKRGVCFFVDLSE